MEHLLKISFAVFAIWYSMQEGEIFGATQKLKLGKLAEPLRDCPVCMCPWYGSAIYWIFWHLSWQDWIMTVIPAMGLNAILVKLFPDKETPGIHHELGEINDSIVDIGQLLKDKMEVKQPGPKFHPKQNSKR